MADLDYLAMIYGGLKDAEVDAVEEFGARGGHIVAEFNTFASPTSGESRERLEALFGLDWSGWTISSGEGGLRGALHQPARIQQVR
jgi:hypothetical protein